MIVAFAVKSSTERNNFPYRSSRPETCISGLSTYIPPSLSHAIQLKEGTIPHYINGREVHRGYSDAPDKGNPQKNIVHRSRCLSVVPDNCKPPLACSPAGRVVYSVAASR